MRSISARVNSIFILLSCSVYPRLGDAIIAHKNIVVQNFFSCIIRVMKIQTVQLTLSELQEALREYCLQRGYNPSCVIIGSYDKTIEVELEPNGLVTADGFKHRA